MTGIATIRTGELIEESKDKGPFRLARAAFDGDEKDVILINDHGIISAPLKGSHLILLEADGEDGKIYAIAFAPPAQRIDQNKPGENRIKNLKTMALIEQTDEGHTNIYTPKNATIKADGDVEVEAKGKVTVKAPNIELEGEIKIKGNITQEGAITSTGAHTAAAHN